MRRLGLSLAAAAALGCASSGKKPDAAASVPAAPKAGLYAVIGTARGDVEVRLFKDDAPASVAAFVAQGKAGLYDGVSFARVPGFIVQAAARNAGDAVPFESVPGRGFQDAGRLALPAEGGSSVPGEFFVTLLPAPWLDGKHAVMGEVTKGLELLAAASMEPAPLFIARMRFEDRP